MIERVWVVMFGDDDCNGREPVVGALPVDVDVGVDEGSGEEVKFLGWDESGRVDRCDEWPGRDPPPRVRCEEHGRFGRPDRVVVVCVAEVRQRHAGFAFVGSGRSEHKRAVQVCWCLRVHQRREVVEAGIGISVANHAVMLSNPVLIVVSVWLARAAGLVACGSLQTVTVDLDVLPPELARSVRAARRRRGEVVAKPFVSKGLDPVIGAWAKSIVASGELDAAIAEVASSDPDLLS